MSLFNHEQYYMLLFVYVCFSLTTPLVRTVIFTYIHTYIYITTYREYFFKHYLVVMRDLS